MMDRLDAAGLTWKIYSPQKDDLNYGWAVCPTFADCLYTGQQANMAPPDDFVPDLQARGLPAVTYLIPMTENSQHNRTVMLDGDNWIAQMVGAIMASPDYASTAIFITWDDCGCFYDHVPPPPDLGIREPMLIVSPYARPGFTDSNVASFASMLAFVEHTFGLAPLSPKDGTAYDFSDSFNYAQAPLAPIALRVHPVPPWEHRWMKNHPLPDEFT
jgi:phospholipase C